MQSNVTSLNPMVYYELNEQTGTIAYDYYGGHLGAYGTGVSVWGRRGDEWA